SQCADPRAWPLRMRYVQSALDNRISIDTLTMVTPVDTAGNADWTAYDANITPYIEGTAPTRLVGARVTAARIQTNGYFPNTAQVRAWSQHFRQKGSRWFNLLYNYVCDEPPILCQFSEIDPRIALATAADAAIPNLVTTPIQDAQNNGVKNISLYAP